MAPKREKRTIPKRSPGLVITPPAPRPPDDNPALQLFREAKEAQSQPVTTGQPLPQGPPTTNHPPPTYQPPTTQAIAPERDFSRVANSIARDAIPSGLFRGESKKLYDALYQRTRGAVVPRRSVRATQSDLMDWARVSHNTLKAHLKHLSRVGLLKVHYVRGDNTGAEYEVFLPEETPPTTHHPPPTQGPPTAQILAPPTTQNLVLGGGGQVVEESTISKQAKTSFKTNTERTDDEAFAALVAELKRAAKRVTGKDPSPTDRERWKEVAELLATELEIAASRTTVSSAPAFLAEHLRRRLRKADASQIEREVREAAADSKSAAPPKPELTPEQLQEQVNLLAGLMRDGATMKELEEQFAADFRPAQWHMIRSITLAQAGAARPSGSEGEG